MRAMRNPYFIREVNRSRVTLYAGCGIVADSDPDREWEESRIKMRAIAAALGRAGDEP